jgi:hypothetical protein
MIYMQVCGNGHCVNVDSRYDSPYTKVWEVDQEKAYWIQIPYAQAFDVVKVVSDTIREHGRQDDFWLILGTLLESKFVLIPSTIPKRKTPRRTSTPITNKSIFTASYAEVIYIGTNVEVKLHCANDTKIIIFERRKSWSHRKYVENALQQSGIKPSWDFRYGWEYVG